MVCRFLETVGRENSALTELQNVVFVDVAKCQRDLSQLLNAKQVLTMWFAREGAI
jgi:hypothetical protein